MKRLRFNNFFRYSLVLICFALIILRILIPNINFDQLSLYLLIIATVLLLFPYINDWISNIKKIKIGNYEIEIGNAVNKLDRDTSRLEESIKEEKKYPELSYDFKKLLAGASADPRGALLIVAIEIESIVRKLAEKAHIEFGSTTKLVIELSKRKIIDEKILPIFKDFWNIRNRIVHGPSEKVSENIIYELTYLGYRILTLLSLTKDST
jgi:uncharacterized protein YutE (UPF0331/DUF86 family)